MDKSTKQQLGEAKVGLAMTTTAATTDYAGIARAIRETWEAIEANPSISREGALRIVIVKLSSLFTCSDPDYSERQFFDMIDGDQSVKSMAG